MNSRNAIVKTVRNFLSLCILFLCAGSVAFAQAGRGSISGLVSDPTGAVVSGAKVSALNHATGVELHTVTSDAGLYSFVSLNPGLYLITASQKGFESVAQDKVLVTVDQVTTMNIALQVGSVAETVTVSGTSALVDTSNSTVGQLIDSATIDRVPLLTRNVYDLVQLSAGVTPANGASNSSTSQAIVNISTGRPGIDVSSYTINGAIQGSVYYMLDGSPLGVAENNIAAILPAMEIPEDGVEEFRVETQNTPASYQSGGAGVISLVSKSGGDQFHGDAFVVLRPDILAANEYFNKQGQLLAGTPNQSPSFHRYQEGGAIGGPILHKKLFFFADYEATQEKLFDNSSQFTVPTTAERSGDFSNDSYTIYNPLAPDVSGMRQPFPGNKLTNYPGLTLNPTAVAFLSHFPKCNYPNPSTCDADTGNHIGNYQLPGLDPITAKRFDVRVDYYKGEKQRLFSRFSFARLSTSGVNAFGNDWDPDYAQNITNARNFIVGDDITLNSTTVLQLRYSFTRHYENQGGDPAQDGFDITTMGFPPSLAAAEAYKTIPIAFFTDVNAPNGNSDGVGGTANYNTFIYASMNHDASATLTKVMGKHELSFGGEYMKRFLNVGQPPAPSGWYYFDISATDQQTAPKSGVTVGGSDFASFLLGMGSYPGNESVNFTQDLFSAVASPYYSAFAQDIYHISQSLTITAGLRWDIFGGKTERHNRLEYFDPMAIGTSGPVGSFPGGTFTGGEVFATSGNRSPFTTNWTNFAPRLGFAWQPEKHLVIRGGGGFYYGPSVHMVSGSLQDSDGYSTSNNWNATCANSSGNSVFNGSNQCGVNVAGSVSSVTGDFSLSNPFPVDMNAGLVPPSQLHPNGLETNLGANLNTVLHSQPTALTYNFNFGLEYELPHQIVLSAGYVGSRGLFLPFGNPVIDLNQLTLSQINQLGNTGACLGGGGSPLCPAQFIAAEPFPQFNTGSVSITGQTNGVEVNGYPGGDSEYSSLQTKVQKRLTNHFTTLASFTWAKLMTDDGNPPLGFVGFHNGSVQDWRNLRYEHSVSPQDVKYQFTWQASYDLPVGKGRALNLNGVSNAILGGWTVDGIFYLSSGVPIVSPYVGDNQYLNQRADMVCDPSKGAPRTAAIWFLPNCFAVPGTENGGVGNPFIPGTAPAYLDHLRTMGANNLDLTFSKTFKLGEKRDIRFDISSYNVANRPQFSAPNVPTSSAGWTTGPSGNEFGQITTTSNTPRQFQFGSRFTF
jgi:hypothetical protein